MEFMGMDHKGIKRPSLKGIANTGYLGHFAKEKWLAKGHNDMNASRSAKDRADAQIAGDKADEIRKYADFYKRIAQEGGDQAEMNPGDPEVFASEYEKKVRSQDVSKSKGDRGGARVKYRSKDTYSATEDDE